MTRRSVNEHAARIAALIGPALDALRAENVQLEQAAGRVLAEPVLSRIPSPAFRNSQMDGYAARAAEIADAPVTLPVAGVIAAAGAEVRSLPVGSLIRVMTGAPVPDGADCVVPVEDTRAGGNAPSGDAVTILTARAAGVFVREAGVDLPAGGEVVGAGVRLAARHLAAIAAAGVDSVSVRRLPRVAVLTTGAEVRPPGSTLTFGEIYDANAVALVALAREAGAEVVLAELVDDDVDRFTASLERALDAADLVLTSGGISQGDWEVVRQVVEPRGVEITEIAMQPGGPQGSGNLSRSRSRDENGSGVPVVCFPGNPVSTQVSFAVFVRPLLRAAAGLAPIAAVDLPLVEALISVPGKRQWRRGVIENGGVRVLGGPGSHLVVAMARADVLIDVPAEVDALPAGAVVQVLPL